MNFVASVCGMGLTFRTPFRSYGGTCRYGAKTYGMKGVCVDVSPVKAQLMIVNALGKKSSAHACAQEKNSVKAPHPDAPPRFLQISEKENAICRKRNKEEGLEHLVSCPGELSCFDTGLEANSYDLVTSQDALMHCGNERYRAIKEAARILKPGGFMSFTDPMQSNTADPQVRCDACLLALPTGRGQHDLPLSPICGGLIPIPTRGSPSHHPPFPVLRRFSGTPACSSASTSTPWAAPTPTQSLPRSTA
jgi:SAM-dependent methyltransferase